MVASKTANRTKPTRNGVDDDLRECIKRIASRLPAPPATVARQDDEEARVLIDTEVDGLRCVLVRKPPPANVLIALSPREREIARMIAKGYPNKMIAGVLEISPWTVGTHLRRIFSKLHVNSRAAMVAVLLDREIIEGSGEH